jgi:hypothetical protein
MFDPALLAVMTQTLTVNRLSGVSTDGYGRPAYSTARSSYACRVTGKQHLVRNLEGEQEVADTIAWVRSTSTFGPSDRITLPDGSTPKLLALEAYRDETGALHHLSLHFSGGG